MTLGWKLVAGSLGVAPGSKLPRLLRSLRVNDCGLPSKLPTISTLSLRRNGLFLMKTNR